METIIHFEPETQVETRLYTAADGRPAVRIFDQEADQLVGVVWFPTVEMARSYFDRSTDKRDARVTCSVSL